MLIGPDAQGNYTEGPALTGGYVTENGVQVPGPLLQSALDDVQHGGDNPGDRDVPLVVYAPSNVSPGQSDRCVENTQVAPTILKLLGLDPNQLQAVQEEGTQVLPGLGH